jgi:tRNA-specific 2-thiouridylase
MAVAVGLSGGVDSSVAAALLVEQGHRVVGVTMRVYDPDLPTGAAVKHACYGPDEEADVEDARKVAAALSIPFQVHDLAAAYQEHVLAYFRNEYAAGRTPNPCMACNRHVKFGLLWDRVAAGGLACNRFATGHYARVERDQATGRAVLRRGADQRKDQSYFLAWLTQEQLGRSLFPLGGMRKEEVRGHARRLGLFTAEKEESQDFASGDHAALLGKGLAPGPIVDTAGRTLGTHDGVERYTVGQRKGLRVVASQPLYVVGIDPARHALVVGTRAQAHVAALVASRMNWVALPGPPERARVTARIRSTHTPAPATVTGLDGGRVHVAFDEAQFAVTPGQSVALYDGDRVLGGGVIEEAGEAPRR